MTRQELIQSFRRDASKDLDWITVNGQHVPIKDGVAVGGFFKGKEFAEAVTEKKVGKKTVKKKVAKKTTARKTTATKTTAKKTTTKKTTTTKTTKTATEVKQTRAQRAEVKRDEIRTKISTEKKLHDEEMRKAYKWEKMVKRFEYWDSEIGGEKWIEHETTDYNEFMKNYRKMSKWYSKPLPKKGTKEYDKFWWDRRDMNLPSGKKEAMEELEERRKEAYRNREEKPMMLKALEEWRKTGSSPTAVEMQKKHEAKRAEHESNITKYQQRVKDDRQKQLDGIKAKFKSIGDCKTAEDVGDYLTASGLFKTEEVVTNVRGQDTGDRQYYDTDFKDIQIEYAKSIVENTQKFFDEYPKMKGTLVAPTAKDEQDGMIAGTLPNSGKVVYNIKKFGDGCDIDKKFKEMLRKGHCCRGYKDDPIRGVITHEMSHAIVGQINKIDRTLDDFNSIAMKIFHRSKNKFGIGDGAKAYIDFMSQVSNYAMDSPDEFVAECFCEYKCAKNPSKIATFVGQELEKEMKRTGLL